MDIWANVPGRLNSSLENTFTFFSIESMDNNWAVLSLKQETPIVYNEEVAYENFEFDAKTDEVRFKALTKNKLNKQKTKKSAVKQFNQGYLETLYTLTTPPEYVQGMTALYLLFNKALGTTEDFLNKLFTVFSYNYIVRDETKMMNTVLKGLTSEQAKNVYSGNSELSLIYLHGLFEWIKMLGNDEKIQNTQWLSENFGLSEDQAKTILGKSSFLYSLFVWFNNDLSANFNCQSSMCGEEILYRQSTDAAVTKFINIANLKELNQQINKQLYPYDISPEMFVFYTDYYNNKNSTGDYQFDDNQLTNLFSPEKANSTLFDSPNMIDLMFYNKTQDLYQAYMKFNIKSKNQMIFLADYIFEFLVPIFKFFKMEDKSKSGTNTYQLNPISDGFLSLIQVAVDQTTSKLSKFIKKVLISKILEQKFSTIENVCSSIISNAVGGDINRTVAICSNNAVNMNNYESIKVWIFPINNQTLKNVTKLSDEELDKVYIEENLGKYINDSCSVISNKYKCGECTNEDLARMQWLNSSITLNPPQSIVNSKNITINDWDSQIFPRPVEMKFYSDEENCKDDYCNAKNMGLIFSLYNTLSNLTLLENKEKYYNRLNLQKLHTLYIKGIYQSSLNTEMGIPSVSSYFRVVRSFVYNTLLNGLNGTNTVYNDSLEILTGNSQLNKDFLKLLNYGLFYNNFKPGMESATGLPIDIEGDEKSASLNLNSYTMDTGYMQNEENVRKMTQINNYHILNANSLVYSPIKNYYQVKNIILVNPEATNKENTFFDKLDISDGFQYSSDKKTVKYYDPVSSRVFEYTYSKSRDFGDSKSCNMYTMNTDISLNLNEPVIPDLIEKEPQVGTVYQKLNKPYLVSKISLLENMDTSIYLPVNLTQGIKDMDTFNFICVDKYSDMVLESNFTMMVRIINFLPFFF